MSLANAYESASSDQQAALRAWMRNIILPGIARRVDVGRVRRSEKESIERRERRILEFPLTMTPREVAKALKAEGCYSQGTTVYHIEYRVKGLREKAQR